MVTPFDSMFTNFGGMIWNNMGTVLMIVIALFILIFVFGGILFFIWWKGFDLKVTIFKPMGQVLLSPEEKEQLANGMSINALKEIKFDYLAKRITHGKDTTHRGTSYFQLFNPMLKKIKPVPMSLRYNDGIFLMQLSKEIYVPIPRPHFVVSIGQNVSISVTEQQEWVTWSNMMADRINAKYQNPDAQQKQALYFVVGVVAIVVVGLFILWMVYLTAKKGLDVQTFIKNFQSAVQVSPANLGGLIPPK